MNWRTCWQFSLVLVSLLSVAPTVVGEEREWTDATGRFRVKAELIEVRDGVVKLRQSDGREVDVPLDRLSTADQEFVRRHLKSGATLEAENAADAIKQIAETFYGDLRDTDRAAAGTMLTVTAQELMKGGQSPLAGLPQPETGRRTIRVGRVAVSGLQAEVPVQVRAGGARHNTQLHLRFEDDQWRVFALSATYPDGEKSINFEAEVAPEQAVDPLLALVGKPLELAGYTTLGQQLDMSAFDDKVVLVDFWATWCGPCRAEMPNVLANYQKYRDAGFEVIAISVDRDMEALKTFVTDEKPPWTVVVDNVPGNRNSMAAKYGIRSIPAFILVGRDGKVAAVNCRGQRLGQQLSQLLAGDGRDVSTNGVKTVR